MSQSLEKIKEYLDTQIYQEFEEVYAAARALVQSCESINKNYADGKNHNIVHYINDMKSDIHEASSSIERLNDLVQEETDRLSQD